MTAADQPTVSVDGTNIYITAPQYNVTGGYAGTEVWVVGDKAGSGGGIYNGGALTVVANELTSSAQGIYRVVAGNNGEAYYAAAFNSGAQTILNLQAYNQAANTFGPATTLALGNSDQGDGGSDFTAQQQGTNFVVTTLADTRYDGGTLAQELAEWGGLSLRQAIGLAPAEEVALFNGKIPCRLLRFAGAL